MQKNPNRQLYIVLAIVLLGFIGNSISYPIFAPLFLHHAHGDIVPSSFNLKWRSIFMGITLMMYPLGQFFGSPILGALSDQHGRKNVLLASSILMIFFYLLTAISLTENILWLLILSRFLTGCSEGNISIARAIAVDNKELNKHKSMGLINAMTSIGYIIGPLIGGILADNKVLPWFNFALPFYTMTIIAVVTTLVIAMFLRESLKSSATEINNKQSLSLLTELNIIRRLKKLSQNRTLKILLISATMASLSYDTFYEFYPSYMTGYWHATSIEIAWYTAILSLSLTISCGWLTSFIAKYCNKKQAIKICLPIISLLVSSLFFLPKQSTTLILFIFIGIAIGICTTNFTIKVSDSAADNIQGEALGTLWGLRTLGDGLICLIGGAVITASYSMPLLLTVITSLIAWIIFSKYIRN